MSALSNVIGNAKSNFTSSVGANFNQVSSLLGQGNIEGAVGAAVAAPGEILNSVFTGGAAPPMDGLGGIQARGDAIQPWCWYCSLPAVNNSSAIQIDTGISFLGTVGPLVTLPWYYVQTGTLPSRSFQTDAIQRNGRPVKYVDSYQIDDLSLGFFMDTSGKAWSYLTAWQALIYGNQNPKQASNQGMMGLPSAYKKDISIYVMSVARKQMLKVKYINCFPKNAGALSLASNATDAMVLDVTFDVEDVDITVSNDKGLISNLLDTASGYALGALSNGASSLANNISSFF